MRQHPVFDGRRCADLKLLSRVFPAGLITEGDRWMTMVDIQGV